MRVRTYSDAELRAILGAAAKALWQIPAERAKGGVAHPVALSEGAVRVPDRIRAGQGAAAAAKGFLFPAPTGA